MRRELTKTLALLEKTKCGNISSSFRKCWLSFCLHAWGGGLWAPAFRHDGQLHSVYWLWRFRHFILCTRLGLVQHYPPLRLLLVCVVCVKLFRANRLWHVLPISSLWSEGRVRLNGKRFRYLPFARLKDFSSMSVLTILAGISITSTGLNPFQLHAPSLSTVILRSTRFYHPLHRAVVLMYIGTCSVLRVFLAAYHGVSSIFGKSFPFRIECLALSLLSPALLDVTWRLGPLSIVCGTKYDAVQSPIAFDQLKCINGTAFANADSVGEL